jgi:hypothetical protein
MSNTLGSWKEIAQYLGKGVRTAQRWESDLGLPVRRPGGHKKGIVMAFTEDIDLWMRSELKARGEDTTVKLRTAMAELRVENQILREELGAWLERNTR